MTDERPMTTVERGGIGSVPWATVLKAYPIGILLLACVALGAWGAVVCVQIGVEIARGGPVP